MDTIFHLIEYFSRQWKVIKQTPEVCAAVASASGYITWLTTKTYYKSQLESLRERLKLAEDREKHPTRAEISPSQAAVQLPVSTVPIREQPKVQITITEGIASLALNDHTHLWILLNVHVNGPTVEVVNWMLELKLGDKNRPGFRLPIPRKLRYSPHPYPPDGELHEVEPIKEWLPSAGWLLFTVPGLTESDPLIDNVFGATFTLMAVERNGERIKSTKAPGTWLHRATQIFPPNE